MHTQNEPQQQRLESGISVCVRTRQRLGGRARSSTVYVYSGLRLWAELAAMRQPRRLVE